MSSGLRTRLCLALMSVLLSTVGTSEVPYKNDFDSLPEGRLPDDFRVLNGAFEIKTVDGNKVVELPGTPLDTYSVLFGPSGTNDLAVAARVFGESTGRRHPSFGVGLGGIAGYRLQMSPGKRAVELHRGDEVVASHPYRWKSGTWTHLLLRLRSGSQAGTWTIEGKAWSEGQREPEDWSISYQEMKPPHSGRASIWGSPFSDKPIRYDDLTVTRVDE